MSGDGMESVIITRVSITNKHSKRSLSKLEKRSVNSV